MLAFQQGCTCVVFDRTKKRRLDNEGVGKKLQTNGDIMESISLHKTLSSQLEVAIAKLQKTMNKMAKFETMAKCMGLALLNLCLEKHILGNQLSSMFMELQAIQSQVVDCQDVDHDWRNSTYNN
jgi:hypothetical protein